MSYARSLGCRLSYALCVPCSALFSRGPAIVGQKAGTTVSFVRDRFARSVPAQLSQAVSVPWFSQCHVPWFSQCHALYGSVSATLPTKVAGKLRRAVRSSRFVGILGSRHIECAYYLDFCRFSQCHALYKTNLQEWRVGSHLAG